MHCKEHTTQLRSILQAGNLKATPRRLCILDVFHHEQKPLCVNDLSKKLKPSGIDRVTLYRNVEILEGLGVLKKVRLDDKQNYYEMVTERHHHHVVCKVCGMVSDVETCKVSVNMKDMLRSTGFAKVTDHSLEFFGVCNKCD
jgi:Fe2+ or Zn2+ uptake regulation protein